MQTTGNILHRLCTSEAQCAVGSAPRAAFSCIFCFLNIRTPPFIAGKTSEQKS